MCSNVFRKLSPPCSSCPKLGSQPRSFRIYVTGPWNLHGKTMLANLNATNILFDYQVPPTIEELSCDWFKYECMLVNTFSNAIIENAGNKEFCIE